MNRSIRVLLAVSVPILAVMVLLLNVRSAQPDVRQEVVRQYVAWLRATTAESISVGQYVQARMPQKFSAAMSRSSFGNSTYYQAQHQFNEPEQPDIVFPLTTTLPPTMTGKSMSGMPIPYPPTDLWCVSLSSSNPATPPAILVALHQDIYNAEWIVHDVTDPATVLRAVGCQFSNQ